MKGLHLFGVALGFSCFAGVLLALFPSGAAGNGGARGHAAQTYEVGLLSFVVPSVADEDLLGDTLVGFYRNKDALSFSCTLDSLEANCSAKLSTGHETACVNLVVSRERGAKASVAGSSDGIALDFVDISGVVAIVSDGSRAAVEFELTCVDENFEFYVFVGRVCGGEALAAHVASLELSRETFERFDRRLNACVATSIGDINVGGYLDSFGRRQGLWIAEAVNDNRSFTTTWKDGLLCGLAMKFDSEGRLSRTEQFDNSLADGVMYSWYGSGQNRSIEYMHDGRLNGPVALFTPEGAVEQCIIYVNDRIVGEGDGDLTLYDSGLSQEDWMGFCGQLQTLHTRAK